MSVLYSLSISKRGRLATSLAAQSRIRGLGDASHKACKFGVPLKTSMSDLSEKAALRWQYVMLSSVTFNSMGMVQLPILEVDKE